MTANCQMWYMDEDNLRYPPTPLWVLQAECRYRGLVADGEMDELAARLFRNIELRKSWRGEREDYKARLNVWQNASKTKVMSTFPRFNDFPLEIQRYIWELSLPGPRILCPYSMEMPTGEPCFNEPTSTFLETSPLVYTAPQVGKTPRLSFDKRYRVPNPAALSVCKASRQVALSKYQLCFGTSQIYADLTTDIIFFHTFAQDIMEFLTDWLDTWLSRRNLADPPPPIIADLLRVQNLGYAYEGVYDTFDPAIFDEHGVYGNLLQHCHLDSYKGLKTVVLCDSVGFNFDDDSSEPGVIQFDNSANLEHRVSYQCATRMIKRSGKNEDETSDDKPKPKIRFAPVKLSYNVPTFWDFIKNPYA